MIEAGRFALRCVSSVAAEPELRPRDDSLVRRPLDYPAAIYVWLAVTLAGVVAALAVGRAAWAVAGWAVGGVAAAVVMTVKTRRDR